MYKTPRYAKTTMTLENTKPGETIEEKVVRLIANKEPIKDGAPIIYTERAHGINPAYNIRTDRWEIAVDAMSRIEGMKAAKRDAVGKVGEGKEANEAKVVKGEFGKTESTDTKAAQ